MSDVDYEVVVPREYIEMTKHSLRDQLRVYAFGVLTGTAIGLTIAPQVFNL